MSNIFYLLDTYSLLLQFAPPRLGLCFPGIEPMFDHCHGVCYGLLFTPNDDLGHTIILPYWIFSSADASNLLIFYKRTSPRGPEAKHLQSRRTIINGVYTAGILSHSPFPQIYVRATPERSLSGTPTYLLLVDAPNRAVPMNGMFHDLI